MPLNPHVEALRSDFPYSEPLLTLVRRANALLTYAAPVKQAAPPHSWALHLRLPGHLERHFGLTREILIYCLSTRDVQVRDARRIQALIRDAELRLEPTLAILVTDDPDTETKLEDWAIERETGITVVPAVRVTLERLVTNDSAEGLRTLIEGSVKARNYYDERDPVTGDRFFGRSAVLSNLDRKLTDRRGHIGLFGLRRVGKTSLVLELRDRLIKRPGLVPVFVDLEATATARHTAYRLWIELADVLVRVTKLNVTAARRTLGVPDDWQSMPTQDLILRVADVMRTLLSSGALRGRQLVLFLDEAEILLPNAERPAEHTLELFRALRGVSQETQQLSLVLAGVNATPTESPILADDDNPLFGLLSVEYLGPLDAPECEEMIRRLGRRMQVRWDGTAVSVLTAQVGGHPLLARLAASDVVSRFTERPLRPTVANVEKCMHDFYLTRSAVFEQMVHSLRRYYPDEMEVLGWLSIGETDVVRDLVRQKPSLLNHLIGYGVVRTSDLTITIPTFDRWLFMQQGDR